MTPEINHKAAAAISKRNFTKSVEMLLGMITGMMADGQLHDLEIKFLSTWLAEHQDVTASWPGSFIAQKVSEALADGSISDEERNHLRQALQQLASSDFSQTGSASAEVVALPFDDQCTVRLAGAKICLTGDFLFGTRAKCEQISSQMGAIIRSSVSGKTDFLVVGTLVSPSWAHTSFGRKIQQAMDEQQAGSQIKIITEQRWHKAVEKII